MAIHDWTRVPAGVFHHLHGTWLFQIAADLNEGLLPEGYFALGEQVVSGGIPDVLTLEHRGRPAHDDSPRAAAPLPSATQTAVADAPRYPPRPRVIVIRHVSGDRVVSVIDFVSPGNKKDAAELGSLVEKTVVALSKGVHTVLIDLHPPGTFDAEGFHNVIWQELGQGPTAFDNERPLQVLSYLSDERITAYIEPCAVGEDLPRIPLFLDPGRHVELPLEASYKAAFAKLPAHLRARLES